MSGAGKTMAAIILLARAIAQGASGFIIDRAGHFDFLVSLIPGASVVAIGGEAHAINSWDVADPALVSAEKVDYLLARRAAALAAGIASERIVLDPGFGFGKTLLHNQTLFQALPQPLHQVDDLGRALRRVGSCGHRIPGL